MDLTGEHRNAAIARANKLASRTVEEKEEEETEGEEDKGTDDDKVEAESSNTMLSFNCETNPALSTLIEDEDSDESEKSMDELALDYRPPPAKRSSSKLHWSFPPPPGESVRLVNLAVDEAAVLTDAQAPKDLLLWNPGYSLTADSIVFEARQKWIREVIIHAMCIIKTAGPTAEGSSGAFGSWMRPRIAVRLAD